MFKDVGLSQKDWDSCALILKNNLPKKLNSNEYDKLKMALDMIDTTKEREKADNAAKIKSPDYLQQQFLGFIDRDSIIIRYNNKKISYKDWFTFKIISSNGKPIRLECGVLADGKSYRIRYIYDSNEVDINYWNDNNEEVYLADINSLPNKLKPFVISLFRYLRKAYNKPIPTWIDRTKK